MTVKNNKEVAVPEWNYTVDVKTIEKWPFKVVISPQDSERAALVKRLGILALDDCEASLSLSKGSGSQIVKVKGEVRARVRQNCVVTMKPVAENIHETFEAWYADPKEAVLLAKARRDKQVEKGRSEMPVLSEQEDPEAMIDGKIELGELVAQYLSLAIDPYPHAEGAEYKGDPESAPMDAAAEDICKSPFAALKDWKDRQK